MVNRTVVSTHTYNHQADATKSIHTCLQKILSSFVFGRQIKKAGDRFWFENQGVMTVDQMKEIRKMGLGSLSCATFEGAGKESLMAINPWKASGDTEGEANNLKK